VTCLIVLALDDCRIIDNGIFFVLCSLSGTGLCEESAASQSVSEHVQNIMKVQFSVSQDTLKGPMVDNIDVLGGVIGSKCQRKEH